MIFLVRMTGIQLISSLNSPNFYPVGMSLFAPALENEIIGGIYVYCCWIPVEVLFVAVFATTPAKWIFGISVRRADGNNLSLVESFVRSIRVWVQGMGGGLPLVVLITNYFSYRRLVENGSTSWDQSVGVLVVHRRWSVLRWVAVLATLFMSFLVISIIVVLSRAQNTGIPIQGEITGSGRSVPVVVGSGEHLAGFEDISVPIQAMTNNSIKSNSKGGASVEATTGGRAIALCSQATKHHF